MDVFKILQFTKYENSTIDNSEQANRHHVDSRNSIFLNCQNYFKVRVRRTHSIDWCRSPQVVSNWHERRKSLACVACRTNEKSDRLRQLESILWQTASIYWSRATVTVQSCLTLCYNLNWIVIFGDNLNKTIFVCAHKKKKEWINNGLAFVKIHFQTKQMRRIIFEQLQN